jgi:hypothetical protein
MMSFSVDTGSSSELQSSQFSRDHVSRNPAARSNPQRLFALGDPMAKLTTPARNKLATAQFAGPGRTYPVPDKAHAANAKARATQQVNAGNLSPSAAQKIKAKANKVLKK